MSVILPNVRLTVTAKPHPWARDEHGLPVAPPPPIIDPANPVVPGRTGPFPGAVKERPETGFWNLRLDPRHWPVEPDDTVTDGTRVWVVVDAQLHTVPGVSDVDHIAVRANLDPPKVP